MDSNNQIKVRLNGGSCLARWRGKTASWIDSGSKGSATPVIPEHDAHIEKASLHFTPSYGN